MFSLTNLNIGGSSAGQLLTDEINFASFLPSKQSSTTLRFSADHLVRDSRQYELKKKAKKRIGEEGNSNKRKNKKKGPTVVEKVPEPRQSEEGRRRGSPSTPRSRASGISMPGVPHSTLSTVFATSHRLWKWHRKFLIWSWGFCCFCPNSTIPNEKW